jgi:hypothetical protein
MNEIEVIRHVREQTETQFEPIMSDLIAAIGKVERFGPLTDEQLFRLGMALARLQNADLNAALAKQK